MSRTRTIVRGSARDGAGSPSRPGRAIVGIVLLLVAAGLDSMASLPTIIVVGIGMLPAIVAFVVDDRPGRHVFQTVAALNFAGVAPVVMALWREGVTLDSAITHIVSPYNLLAMYGAAAIGWALVWLAPFLTSFFVHAATQYQRKRLDAEYRAIEEDWDLSDNEGAR